MTIPVFYRPEQNAFQEASPSSAKPQFVVESWLKRGLAVEVHDFTPATLIGLCKAHDPQYVRGVLTSKEPNGFGTTDVSVAKSLPYTSGSMLAAAREAIASGVACSPTSGFHHAGYNFGGGYCTFNGLMVAALVVIDEKLVSRVGILDMDTHYGDGTDDIIKQTGEMRRILNNTRRGNQPSANQMLVNIVGTLQGWKSMGIGLVLYQAGADPHIDDPFGGHYTSGELRKRDHTVFKTCRKLNLPVAWNLAGGYQEDKSKKTFAERIRPVLNIHDATMEECIAAYKDES